MVCITADVCFVCEGDGGRPCMPVGTGYAPHLVLEGTEEYLGGRFIQVPSMAVQGTIYRQRIQLLYPNTGLYSGLQQGQRFQIREGQRVVGTGVVMEEARDFQG